MKVSFSEVENIFTTYLVWSESRELLWYRKAWSVLDYGGLTKFTNNVDKSRVIIRAFTLILIYNEFCQLAFKVGCCYGFDYWEETSNINAFRLGQIYGKDDELNDSIDDEDVSHYIKKFNEEYGYEMFLNSMFMNLVYEERYNVIFCLTDNMEGREVDIFISMYLATFVDYGDDNETEIYEMQIKGNKELSDFEKYLSDIEEYRDEITDSCDSMEAWDWVLAGTYRVEF